MDTEERRMMETCIEALRRLIGGRSARPLDPQTGEEEELPFAHEAIADLDEYRAKRNEEEGRDSNAEKE